MAVGDAVSKIIAADLSTFLIDNNISATKFFKPKKKKKKIPNIFAYDLDRAFFFFKWKWGMLYTSLRFIDLHRDVLLQVVSTLA